MSDKIVSLSKARKTKARAEKRQQADENAVKFGRTKAERARDEAQSKRTADAVEVHRLDPDNKR